MIRSATALRQLCADLKLDAARARFALVEAMSLAGVCDPETARETLVAETLDKIEHDPGLKRLESLTQATIAVAEIAPDVDQHLDQAEEACTGDAAAYCIVGLLRIVGLLDRGLPAADLARNIIEQAHALDRTDLETMARFRKPSETLKSVRTSTPTA